MFLTGMPLKLTNTMTHKGTQQQKFVIISRTIFLSRPAKQEVWQKPNAILTDKNKKVKVEHIAYTYSEAIYLI